MHLIVSWEIDAKQERWAEINEELRKPLGSYAWAKPLTALYVVSMPGPEDRDLIFGELERVAKATPEDVRVVVSPVMSGGMYMACLPQELWLHVAEVAES